MDALQQFNDGLRQSAHAQATAQRTAERRQTPEQRDESKLEALVAKLVAQEMQRAFAGFIIHSGQGITANGTGRNITIGLSAPNGAGGPVQPLTQPQWYEVTDCDGATFEVSIRNFTPPP